MDQARQKTLQKRLQKNPNNPRALKEVARAWLNDFRGDPWFDTIIPDLDAEVWRAAVLEVAANYSIHNFERLEPLLNDCDDATLAKILVPLYSVGDKIAALMTRDRGFLHRLDALDKTRHYNAKRLAPASLLFRRGLGEPVPKALVDNFFALLGESSNIRGSEVARVIEALPSDTARDLLRQLVNRDRGWKWTVYGALKDPALLEEAIAAIEALETFDAERANIYVDGLAFAGEAAAPALCEMMKRQTHAGSTTVAAMLLGKLEPTPEAGEALAMGLGHSAKQVRTATVEAFRAWGDPGLVHLTPHLNAKRKTARISIGLILADRPLSEPIVSWARTASQSVKVRRDLQTTLEALTRTPGIREHVEATDANMDDETRARLVGHWETWRETRVDNPEVIEQEGDALWVAGWRWLRERGSGEAYCWSRVLEASREKTPLMAWLSVEATSNIYEPATEVIYLAPLAGLLAEPAEALHLSARNRTQLYKALGKADSEGCAGVFLVGLDASLKSARDVCVEHLSKVGAKVAPEIIERLAHKRKSARSDAARILRALALPEASSALEEALEKEKHDGVILEIHKAIDACRAEKPAAVPKGQGLISHLESLKARKLPTFLKDIALPELRLLNGEPISGKARLAFIGLLQKEGPDNHSRETHTLGKGLDPTSRHALGGAIYDTWQKLHSMRKADVWGLYQLAITAGPRELRRLLDTRATLEIIERHDTPLAWTMLHGFARKHRLRLDAPAHQNLVPRDIRGRIAHLEGTLRAAIDNHVERLGSDREALAAQGLFFDSFGVEMCCGPTRALVYLNFSAHFEAHGHTFTIGARATTRATPGQLNTDIELIPTERLSSADPALPQAERKLEKHIQTEQEYGARTSVMRYARALEETFAPPVWSVPGWQKHAIDHPLYRQILRSLVYRQHDGPLFALDGTFAPADLDDNPVKLNPEKLVAAVDLDALPDALRSAWCERIEGWERARLENAPTPQPLTIHTATASDHLAELRGLIYDTPSAKLWDSICLFVEKLPEGEALQTTIDYAREHLRAWSTARARPVPFGWLHAPNHADKPFGLGEDPRLAICDTLWWGSLSPSPETVQAISHTKGFDHITQLGVHSVSFNTDLIGAIIAEHTLPSLRRLVMRFTRPSMKDWKRLVASTAFRRLTSFETNCAQNALKEANAEAMIAAGGLANLRKLTVGSVTPPILEFLVNSPDISGLEVLELPSRSLDDVVQILIDSPHLTNLKQLEAIYYNPETFGRLKREAPHLAEVLRTS